MREVSPHESSVHDRKVNKNFTAVNMASHFSGVLQLTDLDDFITPSQVSYRKYRDIMVYLISSRRTG